MNEVATLLAGLAPKEASTGSKGFYATGKVTIGEDRFQASAAAWLIGSKNDPSVTVQASTDDVRSALSSVRPLPKTFSTGKVGFYGQSKLVLGDERYQASITLTKLS